MARGRGATTITTTLCVCVRSQCERTADTDQAEAGGGVLVDPARVVRRVVQDAVEQVVLVVPVERRLADQHLVQQHAERPPVHRRVVLPAAQDLQMEEMQYRFLVHGQL